MLYKVLPLSLPQFLHRFLTSVPALCWCRVRFRFARAHVCSLTCTFTHVSKHMHAQPCCELCRRCPASCWLSLRVQPLRTPSSSGCVSSYEWSWPAFLQYLILVVLDDCVSNKLLEGISFICLCFDLFRSECLRCLQVLWAFCVYLEAVSVLPQLRMIQKSKVRLLFFWSFCQLGCFMSG